ncbi:hypothetical protein KUV80_04220 [Fictibacillus nanhaiensis]|uniref:hypothetical protein n=1 Tax=Fictibacillus nanhaiensis TaxID=742169 RepID=UPI001C977DC8|nr:hypothetical protein [Fictibacillus nanhaiensis]MBY6035841.1 hypothetical protein [Fictibacillus nanhaiensis]
MTKLSMPTGLLLEAAISGGVAGDKLVEVLLKKDLESLKHIGKEETSWRNLFQFAENNWESIVDAIQNGYSFKFITVRGLQNLLQTRFAFIENQDFQLNESGINLELKNDQLEFLRSRVPTQWQFIKHEHENGKYNYRAVLSQTQHIIS